MKREFLEGMGLEKEAIDKIMAEHGKTVESHKSKSETLQTNVDDLNEQLTQRDKDLKDLKKQAEGNVDLQKKYDVLEKQYTDDKTALETKVKDTQLSSAIKLALAGKVHDSDIAISQIDKETIELGDDGKITKGLDEQIKTLQESKPFLFVGDKPKVKGASPAEGGTGGTNPFTKDDFRKMSYKDKVKLKQESPEQYNALVGR